MLRVNDYPPSNNLSFNDVKNKRTKQLLDKKAIKQSIVFGNQLLNEIKNEIKDKKTLYQVIEKHQLSWKKIKNIQRNNKEISKEILEHAFSIVIKKKISDRIKNYRRSNGKYVLIYVKSASLPKPGKEEQEFIQACQAKMRYDIGQEEFTLLKKKILKQASIELFSQSY